MSPHRQAARPLNPTADHYAVLDGTAGNAILNAANGIGAALVGGYGDTMNGATSGGDTFVFWVTSARTQLTATWKGNGNFDVIQLSKADFGTNPAALANDSRKHPAAPTLSSLTPSITTR
jgi:hypothetical protein